MASDATASGPSMSGRLLRYLRQRSVLILAAALVVALGGLVLVLGRVLWTEEQPIPTVDVDSIIAQTLEAQASLQSVSSQVYESILPSLVVVQGDRFGSEGHPGIGGGVVVSDFADVLTALHVIESSSQIQLAFADGTITPAFVLNTDPDRDIAVLRPITSPGLIVPATIGASSSLRVGDEVFAVGNPLGLVASLSGGVVSGLNRDFRPRGGDLILEDMIQFDAAVNRGSSGGPLLDSRGLVVGIVTGLLNPDDGNTFTGIGFAVPIEMASGAAGGPGK